jgi:hypothetical protein
MTSEEKEGTMIDGVHVLLYSHEAEKVRAFVRDVLGRKAVDAGDGWLIFSLPPAELAVHPTEEAAHHELYLMCDDIEVTTGQLAARESDARPSRTRGGAS